MKYILITGSDGNLGGKLTKLLVDQSEYGVVAVSSFPDRIPVMVERENILNRDKIIMMSSDDMFATDLTKLDIIGAVHFAFSRAIFPNKDIASSLDYSLAAFNKVIESNISNTIYISSQSVYGDAEEWRTVGVTAPAPNSIYAMAKYAGEKIFEACYKNVNLQHTTLRLDNVIQSQNLVRALCKNAKVNGKLVLKGGKQVFSYLDVDDVPRCIYAMLSCDKKWEEIYNVGPNKTRYTLLDVANTVREVAKENGIDVTIELNEDDTALWAGMDTSSFIKDTEWKMSISLLDSIRKIYTES